MRDKSKYNLPYVCICGNKNYHSKECKSSNRKKYYHYFSTVVMKEKRKKYKEKHLCINCGKKAERIKCPHCKKIIGYKARCTNCYDHINKYNEEYQERKNEMLCTKL